MVAERILWTIKPKIFTRGSFTGILSKTSVENEGPNFPESYGKSQADSGCKLEFPSRVLFPYVRKLAQFRNPYEQWWSWEQGDSSLPRVLEGGSSSLIL